jgi:hypothetical protein
MSTTQFVDWDQQAKDSLRNLEEDRKSINSQKFELNRYFSTQLDSNKTTGSKVFRILPMPTENNAWYITKKFHYMSVGGKWVKIYDPTQDGEPSPIIDVYNTLNSNPDKEIKTQARKYKSRDFYIVRGIERGKEADGVKFWRFPKKSDMTDDIMYKLQLLLAKDKNFFRPDEQGYDIIINIVMDTSGKKKYPKIFSIEAANTPSPVSIYPQQLDEWYQDPATWRDAFPKKPESYLLVVSQDKTPVWDNNTQKFIASEDIDTPIVSDPSILVGYKDQGYNFQPQSFQSQTQPIQEQPVSNPTYQQPTQPTYQQPTQPTYQQPAQPAYQQPAQPTYQQPAQPAYQQPAQPQHNTGTPMYQQPSTTPNYPYQQNVNIPSSFNDISMDEDNDDDLPF